MRMFVEDFSSLKVGSASPCDAHCWIGLTAIERRRVYGVRRFPWRPSWLAEGSLHMESLISMLASLASSVVPSGEAPSSCWRLWFTLATKLIAGKWKASILELVANQFLSKKLTASKKPQRRCSCECYANYDWLQRSWSEEKSYSGYSGHSRRSWAWGSVNSWDCRTRSIETWACSALPVFA